MAEQRPVEVASFTELDDRWVETAGIATRCVFLGGRNDPDGPVGVAIKVERDVGDRIAGRRSFDTTTVTTVLAGRVMHDGRWLEVGQMYVAPPGDVNGDMLFGPEGGVIFIMFNKRSGLIPTFANPNDQANFDQLLRADVEAVATGQCEKSVSLLPPRAEYTVGRAIVYRTTKEVEEYRRETGIEDW